MVAEFEIIPSVPQRWTIGLKITKAKRCCDYCSLIYGEHNGNEIGPFTRSELKPINAEAEALHNEIDSSPNLDYDMTLSSY